MWPKKNLSVSFQSRDIVMYIVPLWQITREDPKKARIFEIVGSRDNPPD